MKLITTTTSSKIEIEKMNMSNQIGRQPIVQLYMLLNNKQPMKSDTNMLMMVMMM
jgi:hypothetical protein